MRKSKIVPLLYQVVGTLTAARLIVRLPAQLSLSSSGWLFSCRCTCYPYGQLVKKVLKVEGGPLFS